MKQHKGRVKEADRLDAEIENWTRQHNLDDLMEKLNSGCIPAGPIYNIEDIMKDPQYHARDMFITLPDERVGEIVMPGIVPKLNETPGEVKWVGPDCGTHTEEVLTKLGYSQKQIEGLQGKGVIKAVSKVN
ncbi:CoA transferase [Alkalihalobacillus sp. BA299]|uniref:CoA transferase n=1 Tax=Alkalihalobacillus sp. BA299 TaxID=2815938 RepID=UPI001ADC55E2|nr:CoA transferase [Alkalihalobacillus sp. BA299]